MSSPSFKHVGERSPRTPIKVDGLNSNDDYQARQLYETTHPEHTPTHRRPITAAERTIAFGMVAISMLPKINRKQ